jgi:hypothetical protein
MGDQVPDYRLSYMWSWHAQSALVGLGNMRCRGEPIAGARYASKYLIADQIRRQGLVCEEPRRAQRDEQASRPNGAVWTLSCGNAKYRVTLIPDMAANVELIK